MEDSKDRLDPLVKLGILLRCEGEVGGFSACFHIYIYRERERYKSPAHSSTGVRFQSGYAQGGSKISLLTSPEVDFDLEPRAPDQILEKQADRANKGRQSGVAADKDPEICSVGSIAKGASDCFGDTRVDVQARGR
jgi:hypothetical protein